MKTKLMAALVLAIGVVSLSVPLLAHHGTAAFENEKKVTVKGTVTEWLWSNPHCLLGVDVKGDDGKIVHWVGEVQNPVSMTNVGWSKAAIKVGDEVTITGYRAKDGSNSIWIGKIMLGDTELKLSGDQ